jgi:hypothetical protein
MVCGDIAGLLTSTVVVPAVSAKSGVQREP